MTVHIHDVEQRSPEWYALRAGRVGGSDAADVVATRQDKKESAARRDLRTRLATEIITGLPEMDEGYKGEDVERGRETEYAARAAFEMQTGQHVYPCGYVTRGDRLGWSPDGLIGDSWPHGLELKAPRPARQLIYWRVGGVPVEHFSQVVHAFVVHPDMTRITFASYAPTLPSALALYTHTVTRDQMASAIAAYQAALEAFLAELDAEVAEIRTLIAAREAV